MCYDVSAYHREAKNENDKKLKEFKKQFPDTWFNLLEVRKILEENRQHDYYIRDYEHKIRIGVKF